MITFHLLRCLITYLVILIVSYLCLGSSQCYSNRSELSTSAELTVLRPYHLKSVHLVLFWNEFFSADAITQGPDSYIAVPFGSSSSTNNLNSSIFFRPRGCYQQYPRCLVTTNRAYQSQAKTIIFHWRDFNSVDLPTNRSLSQQWIMYNLESPAHTPYLPEKNLILFNLTASYRLDSDLPVPYGKVVPRKGPPKTVKIPTFEDFKKKTKPIAWFVSNCYTSSDRERYVELLDQYIPVDIYGDCGDYHCQPAQSPECYLQAAEKYLFYLSFENSICKDYVTEKLFSILHYNIIPIVFGGANYSQILPLHSYIDATRIPPHDLATLLYGIASDPQKYLKYFEWKRHFQVEQNKYMNGHLYCALCQMMEKGDPVGEHTMTTKQLNNWYFENTCYESEIWKILMQNQVNSSKANLTTSSNHSGHRTNWNFSKFLK